MKEFESLYAEALNSTWHYSTCIMQLRTLVVAQGLVVLSASAYNLNLENTMYFYFVVVFRIIFIMMHQSQKRNCFGDYESHFDPAVTL